jgi:hypothetical protein
MSSPPIRGTNEYQTFQKIQKLQFSIPDELEKEAIEMIRKILVLNPEERPSLDTLKVDPFFQGFAFDLLRKQHPPKMEVLIPLRKRDTTIDDLEYFEEPNFVASDGEDPNPISKDNNSSNDSMKLDTWIPDLEDTGIDPLSIQMSGIVSVKSLIFRKKRGLLLTSKSIFIYNIKKKVISETISLDSTVSVSFVDAHQFQIKYHDKTINFEVN